MMHRIEDFPISDRKYLRFGTAVLASFCALSLLHLADADNTAELDARNAWRISQLDRKQTASRLEMPPATQPTCQALSPYENHARRQRAPVQQVVEMAPDCQMPVRDSSNTSRVIAHLGKGMVFRAGCLLPGGMLEVSILDQETEIRRTEGVVDTDDTTFSQIDRPPHACPPPAATVA